ncbi:MAG TPA: PilN domain-containing protein [Gemmatimonadaceae bacterium]|nr:PilN domain-containing protein [Gemmatimonadaceae bacterium]
MIGINLLPGTGRKPRRSSGGGGASLPKLDIASSLASLRERIRDPWMIGAVAVTLIAVAAVGTLYTMQSRREAQVTEAEQKAVQDSTRYASVLRERQVAEAKRDTVLRSLNLIRAIDDDRFIWPHVMDEVSRALPPYTWIVSLGFTGNGQAQQAVTTLAPGAAGGKKHHAVQTAIPRDTVRIRLVGNTVDIQALTRFMKQLEASPFLEEVQLNKSERATDNGKEVTQFQLDMLYSRPDAELVRRVPLAVSVR